MNRKTAKTTPFPWDRYTRVLGSGDFTETLTLLLREVDGMMVHKALLSPLMPNHDDLTTTLYGGWLEFVSAAYVMSKGVVVHVADKELLLKARHSTIPPTLSLADIKPPFPVMEVRFADDTPPVFYVDYGHPTFLKFFAGIKDAPSFDSIVKKRVLIAVPEDENPEVYISGKYVDREAPLIPQLLSKYRTLATDDGLERLMRAYSTTVIAMLLRMEQLPQRRDQIAGVSAAMGSVIKKRTHYAVLPPVFASPSESAASNGYGRSVSPHWRRAHFRILAHPKFKRDDNGRVRIVEVQAAAIHGGDAQEKLL